MAVESKALLHPEVMRQHVRSFHLQEHVPAWGILSSVVLACVGVASAQADKPGVPVAAGGTAANVVVKGSGNGAPLALAVIDAAHGELVGVGVVILGDDLGDDDALDFDAEHGQPLGEFLRQPVELDLSLEPIKGDFH